MAVKEKISGFRELLTLIRKGNYAPFYLFMGDEDYYIDILVRELESRVVPEEERDFNVITFYGADTEISKVISSAQQLPVMSEYQLVLLKEAQAMTNSKSQLDKLTSYIARPNKKTVLVATYKGDSLPATFSLVKQLRTDKDSILFKSERLKDYQLADPIKDYCSSKSVMIDEKAISLLCDYIGGPLSKLFGELDKLIISGCNERHKITADDIEKNIGISKDFNTFELVKAIAKKDFSKSMMIVNYFAANPKQNPGVMIVSTLFGFFSKLLLACMLKDKSDSSLMSELDLKNSFQLKDYKEAMRFYNSKSALAAVHFIREHDAKSKGIGSFQNEYDLMKELIFNIVSFK